MRTLSQEVKKRNRFEIGTPAIYYNGKKEIIGEVIYGCRGHLSISSYERMIGLNKNIYTPITWSQVRKFGDRTYTIIYKKSTLMVIHIKEIVEMGGGYKIDGNELTYWF